MDSEPELPEEFMQEMRRLALQAAEFHKRMEAEGLFIGDRDLLLCGHCTLMEDVLVDGRLITYFRPDDYDDSEPPLKVETPPDLGLRFEELEENLFSCPVCGTKIKLDLEAELARLGAADA